MDDKRKVCLYQFFFFLRNVFLNILEWAGAILTLFQQTCPQLYPMCTAVLCK